MTQQLDSKMSYVAMHLFLQKSWKAGYGDPALLSAMCLSFDGERSMDPACASDWLRVTGGKNSFTEAEGFAAAKAFLQDYYDIGPLEEVKTLLDIMEGRLGRDEGDLKVRLLWRDCWKEIRHNAELGDPFRTAYCYVPGDDFQSGRLQRNADGVIEFVSDKAENEEHR